MRTAALYEMLFGLLTLVGGIIGYTTAGSLVSLVAGGLAGIILIFAALSMQKGSRTGLYVTLVVTLALLGNFGYKILFDPTARFMPAGLMTILAAISLIILLLVLVQPKERKRIF
jgi:uncharacterized membrane protein (UPF0136 family)